MCFYSKCLFRTFIGHPRVKTETEPNKFWISKPENHGGKIEPEPEPVRPETRGYTPGTHPAAILGRDPSHSFPFQLAPSCTTEVTTISLAPRFSLEAATRALPTKS